MIELSDLNVFGLVVLFLAAAVIIAFFGSLMTRVADQLADITGLGEAMMGAIFLGGITSIPGIVTSVTAAYEGYAELAISNAIGGIAAQTVFLAIADIAYRKANLEHAAASIVNIMQGVLLVVLLSISIIAITGPQITFFRIHPITFLLITGYIFGLWQISKAKTEPMWRPRRTKETQNDEIKTFRMTKIQILRTWTKLVILGVVVSLSGFTVAKIGIALSNKAGISQTVVGGIFTAVATSLPELVVSISAVRQGALNLAVGGIIGGNSFDVLFVAFSDIAYRDGSVYAAVTSSQLFLISSTILLTGILLLGLLRREKHGIGNIGFESFFIIVFYLLTFLVIFIKS